MDTIASSNPSGEDASLEAVEADRYARMMEETLIDVDELDAETFPPDRRFFLADREAWVYDHGKICELIFVRVKTDE